MEGVIWGTMACLFLIYTAVRYTHKQNVVFCDYYETSRRFETLITVPEVLLFQFTTKYNRYVIERF